VSQFSVFDNQAEKLGDPASVMGILPAEALNGLTNCIRLDQLIVFLSCISFEVN